MVASGLERRRARRSRRARPCGPCCSSSRAARSQSSSAPRPRRRRPATTRAGPGSPDGELLYVNEGNRLRRFDVDTIGTGAWPRTCSSSGRGGPRPGATSTARSARCPDGPGGSSPARTPANRRRRRAGASSTPTARRSASSPRPTTWPGPSRHGCEFAPDGTLFTCEVGFQGFGTAQRPADPVVPALRPVPRPARRVPGHQRHSTNFCKLATDLGTAGAVAVDPQGRVYVAQSSGLSIERFSPPFPTGTRRGRRLRRHRRHRRAARRHGPARGRSRPGDGMLTFSGLAFAPNGNIYAASVFTGRIAEYDPDGNLVRLLLAPPTTLPPIPTGTPQGIAVGGDGTIYYADLDLVGTLPDVGPGPNGKVWRIRFDADGDPLPPDIVREGLAFPDGVALFPGNLERRTAPPLEWPTLAGGPSGCSSTPTRTTLTAATAPSLIERWRFRTGRGRDVVADGRDGRPARPRGRTRVVFFTSWDGHVYALDWATGAEIWRFDVGGPTGRVVPGGWLGDDHRRRRRRALVFFGAGETIYALDAATGPSGGSSRPEPGAATRPAGPSPGSAASTASATRSSRRPSSPTASSTSAWTSTTSRPARAASTPSTRRRARSCGSSTPRAVASADPTPATTIRALRRLPLGTELGLPAGFLATRRRCDHPRTPYGCGNVWSSPALDADAGSALLRHEQLRHRRRSRRPDPGTADAALRRGARRAQPRRHAGMAVAAARGRPRRPRVRCGAQPVHDRRRRHDARCRRHRQQGRHVLRARPRRA